jgi:hypothetical protein
MVFLICDRISDGNGNYRRLFYRRITSVGEAVGIFLTDGINPSVKLDNVVVMEVTVIFSKLYYGDIVKNYDAPATNTPGP